MSVLALFLPSQFHFKSFSSFAYVLD